MGKEACSHSSSCSVQVTRVQTYSQTYLDIYNNTVFWRGDPPHLPNSTDFIPQERNQGSEVPILDQVRDKRYNLAIPYIGYTPARSIAII